MCEREKRTQRNYFGRSLTGKKSGKETSSELKAVLVTMREELRERLCVVRDRECASERERERKGEKGKERREGIDRGQTQERREGKMAKNSER